MCLHKPDYEAVLNRLKPGGVKVVDRALFCPSLPTAEKRQAVPTKHLPATAALAGHEYL